MLVRERLYQSAIQKGLRQSTVLSYERLLARLGLLDIEVEQVSEQDALAALWRIDNPNTRRAAVIALRSVLGWRMRIPKALPRRYDLPDEDTLRLALLTSPHEVRGLLMMYAGLRIGEACAVTEHDVSGKEIRVDKQVIELHRTGEPTIVRIGPVKSQESTVRLPEWLPERLVGLTGTPRPGRVRESLRRAGWKAGIDLNPHLLRHWYATTMIERGVPMMVVSRQMRHSDVATTLRTYAQHDSGDYIDRVFG